MFRFLGKIFNGGNPLRQVADVVDRFVDTKEDKYERFKEIYKMQAEDRANARNLYGQDSVVQKVYALVFLIAYICLTGYFIFWAFNHNTMELTDFQVSLISSVWGAMSAKVSTVTDFFFGSSDQKSEKNHDHLIGKSDNKRPV